MLEMRLCILLCVLMYAAAWGLTEAVRALRPSAIIVVLWTPDDSSVE